MTNNPINKAKEALEAVLAIANNSDGIAGWNQNGDLATWSELLPEVPDALAAIDALTAASAEEAQPVAWTAAVEKAAQDAAYVFKDSCNHTAQAIDYMKAVMHEAAPQASQPEMVETGSYGANSLRPMTMAEKFKAASNSQPVVAWLVDGRVEQGLAFDKAAAEAMADANCGTVRPLVLGDGCSRSHPHEEMNEECQRKTVEARIANAEANSQPVSGSVTTPRVDALTAKWDDDGATRGSAYRELRDLARELESALLSAGAQAGEKAAAIRNAALEEAANICEAVGYAHREYRDGAYQCRVEIRALMQSTPAQQTQPAEPKPVATVRVTHKGYNMELSTYVAYALSEGLHDLYASAPAVSQQTAPVVSEDAVTVPEGLLEVLREAAEILSEIHPDHAPACFRFPIIDELEGFALMLAAPAAPVQAQQTDMGQDYAGSDCPHDSCDPENCACKQAAQQTGVEHSEGTGNTEQAGQVEKDAERYRVLRDPKYQQHEDDPCVTDDSFNTFFDEDLDNAVDALKDRYDAIAKEKSK